MLTIIITLVKFDEDGIQAKSEFVRLYIDIMLGKRSRYDPYGVENISPTSTSIIRSYQSRFKDIIKNDERNYIHKKYIKQDLKKLQKDGVHVHNLLNNNNTTENDKKLLSCIENRINNRLNSL